MTEGEHDAIEGVWAEHGPKLWRSLLAFTADADVASDAIGGVRASDGTGIGPPRPERWIWRAAFRIAAGDLQARRREVELTHDLPYDMPESTADLVRAMRQLSPNQRAVIVLHVYADEVTS